MSQATIAPALQDPPISKRVNTITEMSPEAAQKHTIQMLVIGLGVLLGAFFLWRYDHPVIAGIVAVLGVLLCLLAFSKKAQVAPCPFCDTAITGILGEREKPQEVRCPECYEYSVVSGGKVRPMDPASSTDTPRFRSPVFEGAVWPAGCVACGAPPTRYETLKDRSVNAAAAALGRLRVTTATLSNVPYCDVHRNAVELIVHQDRKMDLKWCSLRMFRHYLAANRSKKSLGTKVLLRD